MIANIAWIGIMLFIYKRLFAAARDKTGASVYDDIFKMTRKLFPAKSWSPFREPAGPGINSQHIWYLVGICIAAPVVAGTLHENVVSSSWAAISFALLIGSILGSLMWPSQERNQLNFFSYTLPISRSKVYWSRSAKLILSALGLILAFFTGVVLEISLTGIRSSFDSYVKVGILCAGAIISSAFMAATLSFFTRYKIITTFFSMLLAGQWIWLAYIILSFLQNNYTLFESYSYLAWVIIVSSVLPLATGYFSYSRSPLLELPEAKRSKIATSLFVTLQLWGIFLVAASPCDIAIILFG
jgi:hypothetical protein